MATTHSATTRTLRALGRAASFTLLVVSTLAAIVLIAVPAVTGSQPYSVLTSSMKPTYPPGTLLVVKPTNYQALRVGDVVTHQIESGKPDVITHRIIATAADQAGNRTLILQGDNNDAADDKPVTEVQVRGKLFYAVPYAGYAANWLGNQDRGLATQVAAFGLIGYGVFSIGRAALARKRAKQAKTADVGADA